MLFHYILSKIVDDSLQEPIKFDGLLQSLDFKFAKVNNLFILIAWRRPLVHLLAGLFKAGLR